MTLIGIKNVVWLATQTVVSALFDSMYETFNALTSVLPQHFVEWFSGSVLDSIWTFFDQTGTGSGVMKDEIDGGFEVTSDTISFAGSGIAFNNIKQYDHQNSTIIFIMKWASASSLVNSSGCGFSELARGDGAGANAAVMRYASNQTNFALRTIDGASSQTSTEGSVAQDTNYHVFKIACISANSKLFIDGVLDVTNTTNLPASRFQPNFGGQKLTGSGTAIVFNIRFLEIFNTDVTILSSLYERLFALTEIMKQRVVETFSGSVINDRWTDTGAGSSTIVDAVDEGMEVASGSTQFDTQRLDFNNKRQYDFDDSVMLFVGRAVDIVSVIDTVGLHFTTGGSGLDQAVLKINDSGSSFFQFQTGTNPAAVTATNTDISLDTNFRLWKIETNSADCTLSADGVLKVTNSTNLPIAKLQPEFEIQTRVAATSKAFRCRYLEAYNKGTTPLVESIYELFSELTTIAKQHFWEWFSGSVLHNRWTTNNVQGTNTFQMADVINGGFEIITGTTANDDGSITFNDKRQYDFNASIIIFVMQQITAASYRCQSGFSDSNNLPSGDSAYMDNNTDFTNYRLLTFRLGGGAATNTDIAKDLLVHSFKVETKASSVEGSMDGVLKATNTTNLPAVKMQPIFEVRTLTTAAKTGRIRYLEAKNT